MSYLELPGSKNLELRREALTLPDAIAVYDAVQRARQFKLVSLAKSEFGGFTELIIVDLFSDQVPPHNDVGIDYPERLAIAISTEPALNNRVYPLRPDFPPVLHRNSPFPGFPPDLCLYIEPPIVVRRTWTAESFLRRIEWWLQATATKTLHMADQPVEALFFGTRSELLLPRDFKKRQQAGDKFCITRYVSRRGNNITAFGEFMDPVEHKNTVVNSYYVELPPMIHGQIQQRLSTLGDLHDQLQARGVDLLDSIAKQATEAVPTDGCTIENHTEFSVLILETPLIYQEGGEVASTRQMAFILDENVINVGMKIGCIHQLDGKYYRFINVAGTVEYKLDWREVSIESIDVLFHNDSSAMRLQSGVHDSGPRGTFLGVGALGSAVIELLARAGWGTWTVVDEDYIKPHNLVRHSVTNQQLGHFKAEAVAQRLNGIGHPDKPIAGIVADVFGKENSRLSESLQASEFIVDATTTLDYPRQASIDRAAPRHASIFVTPSGKDGVILIEAHDKATTLISLEAQYYRALIENEWGKNHLDGSAGTYWSGAGCRDISFILPHYKVQMHAAIQAGQLMSLHQSQEAKIRVYQGNDSTGAIETHEVQVSPEVRITYENLTIVLDEGLLKKLRDMRLRYLPAETGGVLLGYWDRNVNALVLVDASGAPDDSSRSAVTFVRGSDGLVEAVDEASRRTAAIVGYVGEWHSHPPGASSTPSTDDLNQVLALGRQMAVDGLPIVQLIVGENDLSILQWNS